MKCKRNGIVLAVILILISMIYGDDQADFIFFPGEEFNITEKQDLRKRVNGRYQGFVYRETRTSLTRDSWNEHRMDYSGFVYVFQEMRRNTRLVARRLENSNPCSIVFTYNGDYEMEEGQNHPALRGVPSFPGEPVAVGDSWRAFGERIVRAADNSPYTKIPIYCEYRYDGIRNDGKTDYHSISGLYAVRYRGDKPGGDQNLSTLDGSHRIDIRIPLDNPENIFMRDSVEEQYRMKNGDLITYSGIILTWFDVPVEFDSSKVEEDVERIFGQQFVGDISGEDLEDSFGVELKREEEGLIISIPDVHFLPNSAQILPSENDRLDGIAEILEGIPETVFLIRGHTADIGRPEGQQVLSEERAKIIVDELSGRGIPGNRFLYEGKGGIMPLDSNDTEEGRSRNRRVEIIILE